MTRLEKFFLVWYIDFSFALLATKLGVLNVLPSVAWVAIAGVCMFIFIVLPPREK